MDDPAKVVIAVALFATVAYTIKAIAAATIAETKARHLGRGEAVPQLTEARLERIEHAVEAIALEVERISEGQRFTTKLLSENKLLSPKPERREHSIDTPT
jgi:hypothetical protein